MPLRLWSLASGLPRSRDSQLVWWPPSARVGEVQVSQLEGGLEAAQAAAGEAEERAASAAAEAEDVKVSTGSHDTTSCFVPTFPAYQPFVYARNGLAHGTSCWLSEACQCDACEHWYRLFVRSITAEASYQPD